MECVRLIIVLPQDGYIRVAGREHQSRRVSDTNFGLSIQEVSVFFLAAGFGSNVRVADVSFV